MEIHVFIIFVVDAFRLTMEVGDLVYGRIVRRTYAGIIIQGEFNLIMINLNFMNKMQKIYFIPLVLSRDSYRVQYFGDKLVYIHDKGDLQLFEPADQRRTNVDKDRRWAQTWIDIRFFSKIKKRDRIWLWNNFDENREYSLDWVEDETQDPDINIERKLQLAAFAQSRSSKGAEVPILPSEHCFRANNNMQEALNYSCQASRISQIYEEYLLRTRQDELQAKERELINLHDIETRTHEEIMYIQQMQMHAVAKHQDEMEAKDKEIMILRKRLNGEPDDEDE